MSNMPDTSLAHLTTVALNVKLFAILKSLRKRESRVIANTWIPAFAGMKKSKIKNLKTGGFSHVGDWL